MCYEKFSTADTYIEMPCEHTFHKDCLLQWLKAVSDAEKNEA